MAFGVDWASVTRYEKFPNLAMFFDRRRKGEIAAIYDSKSAQQNLNMANAFLQISSPRLLPVRFSAMECTRPLQAADLFAWEFYQIVKDVVVNNAPFFPRREQGIDLINGAKNRIRGAIVEGDHIRRLLEEHGSDERFAEMVNSLPKTWNWKVK